MHIRVSRSARVERTTTSCGECRRRKQKCNQSRPCSNCARRFPQPVCEYKSAERRPAGSGDRSGQRISVSPLPTTSSDDGTYEPPTTSAAALSSGKKASTGMQWGDWHGREAGEIARWSGIDVATQFPGLVSTQNPWNNPWTATTSSLGTSGLPVSDDTYTTHPDSIHDTINSLLQAPQSIPSRFTSDGWHPEKTDDLISWLMTFDISASYSDPWPMANPEQELTNLLVAPTKQNTDLLRIFVGLLSRFKASLDGNPDSSNPYIKYYVPYCLKTPLLAQVAIYTAACYLSQTGHIDERVTMAHKGQSIRLLNDHLRSESSSSDEVIAAVIQLIVNEWCWGETNDLRAHLRGLREMIKLRGGFRSLGLHGLISKLAIISDNSIALSSEVPPFLQDGREFELLDSAKVPLRLAHNTPLVSSLPRFADCADALKLHPATASILDDMRFLISTVLALPDEPSAKELRKVHTTSAWIHDRISNLPDYTPLVRSAAAAHPETVPVDRNGSRGSGSLETEHDTSHGDVPSPLLPPQNDMESHPAGPSSNTQRRKQQPREKAASAPVPESPDFLYQSVRLAALMYSRAVMERRPFSSVVAQEDFLLLWTTMWRVSLATWKGVLGVFNWAVLPIGPAASDTPHGRSVKSMLTISTLQMSLDNWELTSGAMKAGLSLQRWLGHGAEAPANAGADDASSDHGSWEDYAASWNAAL